MADWYCSSAQWNAVTPWAATTAYVVGDLRRQLAAPTVNLERVFRCTTAGTSAGSEPNWGTVSVAKGGTKADGSVVWTEVTGNSTFGWAAAHATLKTACASTWPTGGDNIWVGDDHAESTSASESIFIVARYPGSGTPTKVVCVDHTKTAPFAQADLRTTATVTCTAGSITIGLSSTQGAAYIYGIGFSANTGGISTSQTCYFRFEQCQFICTAAGVGIGFGTSGSSIGELINCSFGFFNSATSLFFGSIHWRNDSGVPALLSGGSYVAPGCFANTNASVNSMLLFEGLDLSAVTGFLFGTGSSSGCVGIATFKDCKLNASVVVNDPGSTSTQTVILVRSDSTVSSSDCVRCEKQNGWGALTTDTGVFLNSGASDGIIPYSQKIVSKSGIDNTIPFISFPLTVWNDLVGSSKTVTVKCAIAALPKDIDVWMEVEYLGDAASPKASRISTFPGIFAAGTTYTDSGDSWTSSPGHTFLLTTTFTPQVKGPVQVKVFVGLASTTLWVDPRVIVS